MSSTAASALRRLGLADARLAFQQQRLGQAQAEEHRGGEPLVNQVVDVRQSLGEGFDVGDQVADFVDRVAGGAARTHAARCRSNVRRQPSPQK